ncbi:MAG: hypothetical protein UU54_C0011G0002 [Candidatus Yanofskybacteria bacterium GW2011_GWA2_41_22]|uniref:LysM domain-containing protein n=4 Tax=Candidatus Yanofskyibacteriota TaxID=1752733 RepID=A0A1F8HWK9_9BACT|nr:MAG: hypothetical protein UU54_C0011G0002 [Candidatus Yanofskybacteria bacterium GW2011_GWA2_41_22]KKS26987.1 MAG: hypothetical protein UU84_C0012G0002 [Candidatus Yanofskybacteria bacterium GW2011_GWC2_41_9]OGM99456.1 MAG: hypothetical protein A2736_01420 [Candidatus Yanofskybacteria bacterium RIFCSPHIGHO2_01_FULL_41_27]OGN20165.1 MAG: hypothetical protein A3B00_02485 [Candidatus Yanofskybacteria bacterium RIFCSPLOWO2_01_FULL_41_33]OGN41519.1 MAG: hypothetical protein A2606_04070 [Candidatu
MIAIVAAIAEQDGKMAKRIKNLYQSRFFGVYGTLFLVILIIALKGVSGEGQASLFSNLVKKYVEETSASMINIIPSQNQLAFLTSSVELSQNNPGRGGDEATMEPQTIQQNSLLANNPVSTDFADTEFKRSQIVEYTVQKGDLLSFIASDYGISMNSIIWANNLRDADSISPGQILKIPPVSGVIHTVKKGDSLASVAKKYGVETDSILEFNSLPQDGQLQIGDEIIVPDGQIKSNGLAYGNKTSALTASRFSKLPRFSDFTQYFRPLTGGYNWKIFHGRNGIDVAKACGTPIYAAAAGTVAIADSVGWNGGFGKVIKITHNGGIETVYAHNSKILVEAGQNVQGGQQIALMGTTGRSTGCHLHFEVHGAQNPLAYE